MHFAGQIERDIFVALISRIDVFIQFDRDVPFQFEQQILIIVDSPILLQLFSFFNCFLQIVHEPYKALLNIRLVIPSSYNLLDLLDCPKFLYKIVYTVYLSVRIKSTCHFFHKIVILIV